jgi:hypothetical protein
MSREESARLTAFPLAEPVRITTIVIGETWPEGWLERLLRVSSIRPLRFIWPDRQPAGFVFAVGETGRRPPPKTKPPRVHAHGGSASRND